jgi:4-hydroxybenzoyl-CoA thioesterase
LSIVFKYQQKVLFQHCDPAGIVFYPRYFEMINATVEAWFAHIGLSFGELHGKRFLGVPTASIQSRFVAPSRLEDELEWQLGINQTGRSSLELQIHANCNDQPRVRTTLTLVLVDTNSGRPTPWKDHLTAQQMQLLHAKE